MNVDSIKPTGSGRSTKDFTPLPAALSPLLTRTGHFLSIWLLKIISSIYLTTIRILYSSSNTKPTLTKYYPCRPTLQVRIFLPQNFNPNINSSSSTLPLYIHTHGGGFAVGDASIDDTFCTNWSNRTQMIVASLNYHKTPLYPFPTAVHDISALSHAIINDPSLPINKSKIVMGGSSAGGNLSLTATLTPPLSHLHHHHHHHHHHQSQSQSQPQPQSQNIITIKAIIAYYPITDWSVFPHTKFANRLCKIKPTESINTAGPFLDWGYVPAGQNRKDKRLSPCYASREELPRNICLVGAQHDMLCREARDMICDLAGVDVPDKNGLDEGDEEGWEKDGYKWVLVKGVRHGFADEVGMRMGGNKKRVMRRRRIVEEMYADVARWLEEKVLLD